MPALRHFERAAWVLATTMCAVPALAGPAEATSTGRCEGADQVPTIDLVEPSLLSGPLHRLEPCARIVGHMAQFELDTHYGKLQARSLELLRIRVGELPAIEALQQRSVAATGADAARNAAGRTVNTVARVASRPLQTLSGLPEGALRFFRRRADDLGERAQALGDRGSDALTGAAEVYDRSSLRPGVSAPEPEASPWWQRGGNGLTGLAKDWVGYAKARRALARQLGIDPYSTNPLLNQRLDALAWASVAGDRTVGLATAQIGGTAADALGAVRRLDRMVWELPPDEVSRRNAARLQALGCGEIEQRRFLRNGRFDPSLQTRLTDALVELQPARGCIDIMELAAAVDSEIEARYLVDAVALLAAHGPEQAELLLVGAAPVLRIAPAPAPATTPARSPHVADMQRREPSALEQLVAMLPGEARVLLPLPVDQLQWTPETAAFFDDVRFRVVDKTALISGDATQNALQGLTRRGWEIAEGLRIDP